MCFYSKGQHRKKFRVTHVVQVPVFALRMEHSVLLQTVTHAVTIFSTAPRLPLTLVGNSAAV